MHMHLTTQAKISRLIFAGGLLLSTSAFSNDLASGFEMAESSLSQTISQNSLLQSALREVIGISLQQQGMNNQAIITQQSAVSNSVVVSQNGTNNFVEIGQYGSNNAVNIMQYGEFNGLTVLQNGNGNLVNAEQTGNQTFLVQQIGDNMVVNITQL